MEPAVVETVKVTAEELGLTAADDRTYTGGLELDLGNLASSDNAPIDAAHFESDPSAACLEAASKASQALQTALYALPFESTPLGRMAQLPAPTTVLPRAKPLPKPRTPTKWEVFAQRKGIQKRKRSKEVWDEGAGELKRRHGYQRANDPEAVPILEAKATDQPGEDPFAALKKEKKQKVQAQSQRQAANLKATAKQRGQAGLPPTLSLAAALPEHGKGAPVKRREMKSDVKAASFQAGVSTASMGKFDKRLAGEKPDERQPANKRRTFLPVADYKGMERKSVSAMADKIMREKADDIVEVGKAAGRLEAVAREQRHQAKAPAEEMPFRGKAGKGSKGSKGKMGAKGGMQKGGRIGGPGGKPKGGDRGRSAPAKGGRKAAPKSGPKKGSKGKR